MCRILGTWHDSSTVNISVQEFCQHRKKKKILTVTVEESCQPLLKNRASNCWRIVPVTVEKSCQRLLNNCASDCWILVPATDEQSCQWLLNNRASVCRTIVSVTVEQSCQWLLKHYASDCWTTVPATVQQVNALAIMSVRKYLSGWARIIHNPVSWLPLDIN